MANLTSVWGTPVHVYDVYRVWGWGFFLIFSQYKKVDSAIATRARLHGLKWPSTNSKFLAVDYLTPEEATRISEGELEVKPFLEASGDGEAGEGGGGEAGEGGETVEMETADTKQQGTLYICNCQEWINPFLVLYTVCCIVKMLLRKCEFILSIAY